LPSLAISGSFSPSDMYDMILHDMICYDIA
jgi:hypothetical protein